jgi:DNA helicase II / ATP-dependent DNA helicase PcrA
MKRQCSSAASHNSFELEIELASRDIPFVKYGGMKLAEAAHVKDVAAFLRIADNPRDTVAWFRMLRFHRGIGARKAEEIIANGTNADSIRESRRSAIMSADCGRSGTSGGRFVDDSSVRRCANRSSAYSHIMNRFFRWLHSDDYPKRQQDLEHFRDARTLVFESRTEFLSALAIDPVDLTAVDVEATVRGRTSGRSLDDTFRQGPGIRCGIS